MHKSYNKIVIDPCPLSCDKVNHINLSLLHKNLVRSKAKSVKQPYVLNYEVLYLTKQSNHQNMYIHTFHARLNKYATNCHKV